MESMGDKLLKKLREFRVADYVPMYQLRKLLDSDEEIKEATFELRERGLIRIHYHYFDEDDNDYEALVEEVEGDGDVYDENGQNIIARDRISMWIGLTASGKAYRFVSDEEIESIFDGCADLLNAGFKVTEILKGARSRQEQRRKECKLRIKDDSKYAH